MKDKMYVTLITLLLLDNLSKLSSVFILSKVTAIIITCIIFFHSFIGFKSVSSDSPGKHPLAVTCFTFTAQLFTNKQKTLNSNVARG